MLLSTGDVGYPVVEETQNDGRRADNMTSSTRTIGQLKNSLRITLVNTSDTTDGQSVKENVTPAEDDMLTISAENETTIFAAVDAAAGKEETAAAVRIQAFLRRRRRDKLTAVSGEEALPETKPTSTRKAVDGEQGRDCHGWFGAAVRHLHQAVDLFLLPKITEADNDHADKKRIDSESEHSDDDSCDWPIFPPLPLRARAPSLYTLPAPGCGDSRGTKDRRGTEPGRGGPTTNGNVVRGENSITGVSTKLDPDVAARLSSARSVFVLSATDVLVAFSPSLPPLPPTSPPRSTLFESNINMALAVPGTSLSKNSRRRRLSPEGLRKRLRSESEDAGRSGLGRPWGSPSPSHVAVPRQRRLAALQREEGNDACRHKHDEGDGGERPQQPNTNTRRPSPSFAMGIPALIALGKGLLAQRLLARRAVRRKRLLGKVDGFRARHVGRQLRVEASADALEGIHRCLDHRMSIAREEANVSARHMQQLLGFMDRFVLSDSQVSSALTDIIRWRQKF